MNCSNCKIANQNVPCIPQGNDFKLAVVLKELIKSDGETSERDINIKDNVVSVAVIKPNGDEVDNTQNVYSSALNGSTVIITFDKQGENESGLPKGKYGIKVTGKRTEDSSDFCFSLPPGLAFEIVADSAHGYFPSDSIITYTVNGVVGVAQNVGEGGGGSGEANVIEVIKVNGTALTVSNKAVDIPVPTNTNQLTNGAGFLTAHQDITGKEDKLAIDKTTPSGTLNAVLGKYYNLGTLSGALQIVLPSGVTTSDTKVNGFIVYLTTASSGSITLSASGKDIVESGVSDIEASKSYELNFVWNGSVWAVTAVEMTAYTQPT